jgi:drug/metabolite transporter (DMT)-like permease
MSPSVRQYLYGSIFFAIGIYFIAKQDGLEGALCCLAGLSFVFNTLVNEPRLVSHKKILAGLTWTLIIVTAILFLWVIQSKYF